MKGYEVLSWRRGNEKMSIPDGRTGPFSSRRVAEETVSRMMGTGQFGEAKIREIEIIEEEETD